MGYFPFFIDLSGKRGLVVGGGAVALRKVAALLPYGPQLTVASPDILPELAAAEAVTLLREPFSSALLEGMDFVIAATGDREVNRGIAAECKKRDILVNAVDDPEVCTFLFPALVKRGELSVGISTGGASPSAAVWVKEQVAAVLPERFEEILDYLGAVRPRVKEFVPESRRAEVYTRLFEVCMALARPLEEEELCKILEETV